MVETDDPDELSSVLDNELGHPDTYYTVRSLEPARRLHVQFNAVWLGGGVGLYRTSWRTPASVMREGGVEDFRIQCPLRGSAHYDDQRRSTTIEPGVAAAINPGRPLNCQPDAASLLMLVSFPASMVETTLQRLLDGRRNRLRFALAQRLDTPDARSWLDFLHLVWKDAQQEAGLFANEASRRCARQFLTVSLLEVMQHSYSDLLDNRRYTGTAREKLVMQAKAWLEDNVRENITARQAAALAAAHLNVSPRVLQEAFRSTCGSNPTRFFLGLRMEAARADLLHAPPESVNISQLARRYMLDHSRFTTLYRQYHGRPPSADLN